VTEDGWIVAVHEAGHLVVAVLAGAEPYSVCAASPELAAVHCARPADQLGCHDLAAFAVAGVVAEELLGFEPAWPGGVDGDILAAEAGHGVDPAAAVARARAILAAHQGELAAVAASLAASPRLGPWGITKVIEAAFGGPPPVG
jgi:hypothetical protein